MGGPLHRKIRSFFLNTPPLIMRKYVRLLLCAIAVVSCLLLFVYHHKYARLNLIFEMMNVIGRRNSETNCTKRVHELLSHRTDWTAIEVSSGFPTWTEVFPNFYVYSSFSIGNTTRTLALIDGGTVKNIDQTMCRFYYSNKEQLQSKIARLHLLDKGQDFWYAFIDCHLPPEKLAVPYGISFIQLNNTSSSFISVISKKSHTGLFSMCVEPLPMGYDDIHRLMEFLIYHHHFGVNHFIFYDAGMASSVKQLLLEVAPKSNIFVTLLPWNVPFAFRSNSSFMGNYFADCSHRVMSRNYSSFLLNANIDQFAVFKNGHNFTTLFKNGELDNTFSQFNVNLFCLEHDDTIATGLDIPFVTLRKTKMLPLTDSRSMMIFCINQLKSAMHSNNLANLFRMLQSHTGAKVLPKLVAVQHLYRKCNESLRDYNSSKMFLDKYMWRYKNLLFKSKLYNLAKQYHLIANDESMLGNQ